MSRMYISNRDSAYATSSSSASTTSTPPCLTALIASASPSQPQDSTRNEQNGEQNDGKSFQNYLSRKKKRKHETTTTTFMPEKSVRQEHDQVAISETTSNVRTNVPMRLHSTVTEHFSGTRLARDAHLQKWPCNLCSRRFYTSADLQAHHGAHTKTGYRCSLLGCGAFYLDKGTAEYHVISCHLKGNPALWRINPVDLLERIQSKHNRKQNLETKMSSASKQTNTSSISKSNSVPPQLSPNTIIPISSKPLNRTDFTSKSNKIKQIIRNKIVERQIQPPPTQSDNQPPTNRMEPSAGSCIISAAELNKEALKKFTQNPNLQCHVINRENALDVGSTLPALSSLSDEDNNGNTTMNPEAEPTKLDRQPKQNNDSNHLVDELMIQDAHPIPVPCHAIYLPATAVVAADAARSSSSKAEVILESILALKRMANSLVDNQDNMSINVLTVSTGNVSPITSSTQHFELNFNAPQNFDESDEILFSDPIESDKTLDQAEPIDLSISAKPIKPSEPIVLMEPSDSIESSQQSKLMELDNDQQCPENSLIKNSDLSLFSNHQIKALEDTNYEINDAVSLPKSLFNNENVDHKKTAEMEEVAEAVAVLIKSSEIGYGELGESNRTSESKSIEPIKITELSESSDPAEGMEQSKSLESPEPPELIEQNNSQQSLENSPNINRDLILFSNDNQIEKIGSNNDKITDFISSSNPLFANEQVENNENVTKMAEVDEVAKTADIDQSEQLDQIVANQSPCTFFVTSSTYTLNLKGTANSCISKSTAEVNKKVPFPKVMVRLETHSTQTDLHNLHASNVTSVQQSEPTTTEQQQQQQQHDSHCFECHKKVTDSEEYQHCSLCPLTYHWTCVEKANLFKKQQIAIKRYDALEHKPEEDDDDNEMINLRTLKGICDECVLKIVGKRFNRSKDGFNCTSTTFNNDAETTYHNIANLLINKVKTWKIWGYKKFIKADILPNGNGQSEVQGAIMDLKTIESKAKKYSSIDEILCDVKIVIHQRHILSKYKKHVIYNCTKLWDQAIEEVRHIYLCDSCYRMFYKEDNKNLPKTFYKGPTTYGGVFLLACQSPHPVVWVQIDGKWWPGKVFPNYTECSFEIDTDLVQVVTFGPQMRQTVEASSLYDYSTEIPENGQLVTENQQLAVKEAEYYVTKQDSDFIEYSIPKGPLPYERGNFYINTKPGARKVKIENQNNTLNKKIKWKCNGCRKRLADRRLDSCTFSYCSERCKKNFLLRSGKRK